MSLAKILPLNPIMERVVLHQCFSTWAKLVPWVDFDMQGGEKSGRMGAKQRKLGDNSQHLIQWFPNFFTWWHSFQACKNFAAPLLQSRRHGGGYGGLSLPKQSAKPPQIEI